MIWNFEKLKCIFVFWRKCLWNIWQNFLLKKIVFLKLVCVKKILQRHSKNKKKVFLFFSNESERHRKPKRVKSFKNKIFSFRFWMSVCEILGVFIFYSMIWGYSIFRQIGLYGKNYWICQYYILNLGHMSCFGESEDGENWKEQNEKKIENNNLIILTFSGNGLFSWFFPPTKRNFLIHFPHSIFSKKNIEWNNRWFLSVWITFFWGLNYWDISVENILWYI